MVSVFHPDLWNDGHVSERQTSVAVARGAAYRELEGVWLRPP
jgi:hypothetical protein